MALAHRTNRTTSEVLRYYEPAALEDLSGADVLRFDVVFEVEMYRRQEAARGGGSAAAQYAHNKRTSGVGSLVEFLDDQTRNREKLK